MSLLEDYETRWVEDRSAFKVAVVDPTISLTRALAIEACAAAKDMDVYYLARDAKSARAFLDQITETDGLERHDFRIEVSGHNIYAMASWPASRLRGKSGYFIIDDPCEELDPLLVVLGGVLVWGGRVAVVGWTGWAGDFGQLVGRIKRGEQPGSLHEVSAHEVTAGLVSVHDDVIVEPIDWDTAEAAVIHEQFAAAVDSVFVNHTPIKRVTIDLADLPPLPIERILLDLDGVLADWVGSVAPLFDRDRDDLVASWPAGTYDIGLVLGVSTNEMWRRVHEGGAEFWAGLEPLPWCHELLELCQSLAPTTILTSPSKDPSAAAGKTAWLQAQFGAGFRDYLIGPDKPACAHPGSLLIDDRDSGCEGFVRAGGNAIVFPQPWNTARDSSEDPMASVRAQLKTMFAQKARR